MRIAVAAYFRTTFEDHFGLSGESFHRVPGDEPSDVRGDLMFLEEFQKTWDTDLTGKIS